MTNGTVLVTGAAGGQQGKTGRRVTELLRERGVPVRAMVRALDDRAEYLRSLGAEVVVGDFLDFRSMQDVVRGVSAVYFAYPVQQGLLDATVNMAVAARNAGVERLVDMVMLVSAPDAPTPRMRENYLSEQVFEWAGIGAAHVRATVFFENIAGMAKATIPSGVFLAPFGDDSTAIPLVAGEDVARVAAGVLTAPDVPAGSAYPVIGQILTVREIVATLARGLGREIAYQHLSDEAWADAAASRINAHAVAHLSKLWATLRSQPVDVEVTGTIEELGGRKPKTFAEFVSELDTEEKLGLPA
jgi:uncharacterized protein YbjT (DUF2867 family)